MGKWREKKPSPPPTEIEMLLNLHQFSKKGTYNIIEINPNCKIITKDFKIDEIKDREDLELHAEPFKVVSFPALDNPSYLDFKELKESHDKLKALTDKIHSSQRKMDEDLGKNEVNDKLNQERVNEMEVVKDMEA